MPLGWFSFGMGVEETRGKHVLLSQEASVQGLSEVFQRLKLPQQTSPSGLVLTECWE